MRVFWQFWNPYFNSETCQRVIDQALKIPPQEASVYGGAKDARKSNVRWLNRGDESWKWLFDHVENIFRRANNAFGFDLNYFHEIQFTEYHSEYNGFYNWHEDLLWRPQCNSIMHRKLSFVMQLTDPNEYTGGDLEFDIHDEKPDPMQLRNRGSAIVFPSFVRHRVVPVTSGVRYSLVTWYEGPCFR